MTSVANRGVEIDKSVFLIDQSWLRAGAAALLPPSSFRVLVFFALLFVLQGCGESVAPAVTLEGETMGTWYQIKVVSPEQPPNGDELHRITEQALVDVNQMMSTYIADSELMKFNRSQPGEWVDLSEPLYHVLALSEQISRQSGGAFDITIGPLVNLWGFGPERKFEPPPEEAVVQTLERLGYHHVELRESGRQARRLRNVELDLSAIAKGYGADYLAEIYQRQGLNNFMIEIGGELRLAGHNPQGKPWRIGVEKPSLARSGVVQAVEVTEGGVATSGDYRNYYEVDGKRYSHTIDPTTGYPITHELVSVTVVAETAAEADGWATALNVLGAARGRELAEAEGLAAYFVEHQNGEFVSSQTKAFEAYLP